MKNRKKWLLPLGLVLLLVIANVFYAESIVSQAETIPSESIQHQVETMYNGKVNDLALHNDIYEANLDRDGSIYTIRIDGETGKVLSVVLEEPSKELATKQNKEKKEPTESEETKPETPAKQPTPEPKPETVQPNPAPQPETKPVPEKKPQPKPQQPAPQKTVLLTEQQAIQIALRQLNGEVDDVDFVKTSEGGYYLVEIEIDVDDGPDEATYQIHAISGKIMSVTWDD